MSFNRRSGRSGYPVFPKNDQQNHAREHRPNTGRRPARVNANWRIREATSFQGRPPFGRYQRPRVHTAENWPGNAGPLNGMMQNIRRHDVRLEDHRRADRDRAAVLRASSTVSETPLATTTSNFLLVNTASTSTEDPTSSASTKTANALRSDSTRVHEKSFSAKQTSPITDRAGSLNPTSRPVPTTGDSFGSVNPSDAEPFDAQDVIYIETVTNVPAAITPSNEISCRQPRVNIHHTPKPRTSAATELTAPAPSGHSLLECPPVKKVKRSASFSGYAPSESHTTPLALPTTSTWLQKTENRKNSPLTRPNSNSTTLGTPNTESDSTAIRSESATKRLESSIPTQKSKYRKRTVRKSRSRKTESPQSTTSNEMCEGKCQCPTMKKKRKRLALGKEPEGLLAKFEEVFKMGNEGELQQVLIALSNEIHRVLYTEEGKKVKTRLIKDLRKILKRSSKEAAPEEVVPEITIHEDIDEPTNDLEEWEEDWPCTTPTNKRAPYSEFREDDWERIRKMVPYGNPGRMSQPEPGRNGLAHEYTASYRCLETGPEKIDKITEKFTQSYHSISVSYKVQQGFYSGVELETTSITFTLNGNKRSPFVPPTVTIRFSENSPPQSFELSLFKEISVVPPLCPGFPSCVMLTPSKMAEQEIFAQMEKLSPRFKDLRAVMRIGKISMTVSKPLFFVLKSAPLEPDTECTVRVLSNNCFLSHISATAGFIFMTCNFPLYAKNLEMNYLTENLEMNHLAENLEINYLTDSKFWEEVSSLGLVWVFLAHGNGSRRWSVMSRDSIPVRCTSNFVEWSEVSNRIYPLYPPTHPFRPLQIEPNLNWDDGFDPGERFPFRSIPPRAHGDSANESSTSQLQETSPLSNPVFVSKDVPRKQSKKRSAPQ